MYARNLPRRLGISIDFNSAVSFLPQPLQAQLSAVGAQVQQAQPLLGLAQTIEAGQAPSEGQVMAGLAAAGTLLTGNPIAGAALAAAGGVIGAFQAALESFFTEVGWIQPPDPAVQLVGLRSPNDPLPADSSSPLWWHINSVNDLQNIITQVNTGQAGVYNVDAYNYLGNSLQALKTPGYYTSWCYLNPNAFELFFLPMLVKDLERWANGAGFMMPRDLLTAAAQSWNSTHTADTTQIYTPVDRGTQNYDCASPVSQLLGAGGDLKPSASYQADPITINLGPSTAVKVLNLLHLGTDGSMTTTPAPSASSSAVKTAAGTAVGLSVGAIIAATVASYIIGKPVTKVLDLAWEKIKKAF
jgi:hypothetical protein